MHYKRKIFLLALLVLVINLICIGCMPESPISNSPGEDASLEDINFGVHFIDVGQGDCSLITFSDGVSIMIDCGDADEKVASKILDYLEKYEINELTYLLLTHPDTDHIGSAKAVLDKVSVKNVILPDITSNLIDEFTLLKEIQQMCNQKHINQIPSKLGIEISGEDYLVAFLSPAPKEISKSPYRDLLLNPTDSTVRNNISPIVFVKYKNTTFLFTGDAGTSQESYVILNYEAGLYSQMFKSELGEIKLEDIDYLKVAHHGSEDCTSTKFLQMLNPKNAIISVGGNNVFGHPSPSLLYRLEYTVPNCALYRTDVCGDIFIQIGTDGRVQLKKEI